LVFYSETSLIFSKNFKPYSLHELKFEVDWNQGLFETNKRPDVLNSPWQNNNPAF